MKVKVINLNHRTDRWHTAQKQLRAFGINDFERFPAFSTPTPVKGNARSHFQCLTDGADIIFEDDIFFEPFAQEVFKKAISQLPEDWDILYLTGNIQEPLKKFSENLYRCTFAWGSCAILYSEKGKQFVLDNFKPDAEPFVIYDEWLRLQSANKLQAYITFPVIAWTYGGISDVNGYYSNYEKIMKQNAAKHMI